MNRTPGVTPRSPPRSLPFLTLTGAKRAKFDSLARGDKHVDQVNPNQTQGCRTGSTITPAQLDALNELLKTHKGQKTNLVGRSNSPLSSPPNESHLKGYINFLGIRNKEDTLNKLIANGFNSHKVFKSPGLLCSEVRELGLTLGVVTVLFDNVTKYDKYLASHHQ